MRITTLLISLVSVTCISAQQTDLRLNFNSGLFGYRNVSPGFMNLVNYSGNTAYTNHPTSGDHAFSYGLSFTAQRITRYHLVYGIDAGFESLASKQKINEAHHVSASLIEDASGKSVFRRNFLNSFLFTGYSYKPKKFAFALKGGLELATQIGNGKDRGEATLARNDSVLHIHREVAKPDNPLDARLRLQLEVSRHKLGFYAATSYGFVNYYSGFFGFNPEAYSRYVRLGIFYNL